MHEMVPEGHSNGISPDGVGPILAALNIKYKAPVTYPDEVIIGASVKEMGQDYIIQRQSLPSHFIAVALFLSHEAIIVE